MEALGIPRGDYVIKVNNRKVLDGVLESIGLGGDENAGRRLTVLRAIDKLDQLRRRRRAQAARRRPQGRERRLHQGRRASTRRPTIVLASHASLTAGRDRRAKHRADDELDWRERNRHSEGVAELDEIAQAGRGAPATATTASQIDPSVVRGLEYYTGPVFEAELHLGHQDEKGRRALRLGRRRRAL